MFNAKNKEEKRWSCGRKICPVTHMKKKKKVKKSVKISDKFVKEVVKLTVFEGRKNFSFTNI